MNYEATNFDAANGLIRYASPGIGGGLSWRTANGTETLDTVGVTDAYGPRWVIYRENLAGLKIPAGTKISGAKTAAGIVVLNKDGSDPAEYLFIKTTKNGKTVFVDINSVKADKVYNPQTRQWDVVPNSWEVISDTYPYFTDVIIDQVRDSSSKIPSGYELSGEVVSVKTRASGDYAGMKEGSYLRTTVGGNEVYVPMDALRRKGGNRGVASENTIATTSFPGGPAVENTPSDNGTPVYELNSKGKMVIGAVILFIGTIAVVKMLK